MRRQYLRERTAIAGTPAKNTNTSGGSDDCNSSDSHSSGDTVRPIRADYDHDGVHYDSYDYDGYHYDVDRCFAGRRTGRGSHDHASDYIDDRVHHRVDNTINS